MEDKHTTLGLHGLSDTFSEFEKGFNELRDLCEGVRENPTTRYLARIDEGACQDTLRLLYRDMMNQIDSIKTEILLQKIKEHNMDWVKLLLRRYEYTSEELEAAKETAREADNYEALHLLM